MKKRIFRNITFYAYSCESGAPLHQIRCFLIISIKKVKFHRKFIEIVYRMAQHSTRLQNLTHADIIRIGANFENELRNELKAAADQETERKVEFDTLFVRMTS